MLMKLDGKSASFLQGKLFKNRLEDFTKLVSRLGRAGSLALDTYQQKMLLAGAKITESKELMNRDGVD